MPAKLSVWVVRLRTMLLGPGFWEWKSLGVLSLLVALLLVQETATQSASSATQAAPAGAIPTEEFSRLVREFSEEEGYFFSDNFISNETAYLHVVDKLRELEVSGGAYVGVGPEQNFTYIANIRPEIAFIVDIRRQAIIQHLLYKALFHLGGNRVEFLSLLLSKPLPASLTEEWPLDRLVEYFSREPYKQKLFVENLVRVRRTIEQDFRIPLSENDLRSLEHVYGAFAEGGLYISFRFGQWSRSRGAGFPNLRDLILAEDLKGKRGSFLAREDDYQFLRRLHRQNRIIPVVGDFAGGKALAAVANYLRKNHYTVSAFYTSNVEQYLFGDDVYDQFTKNVRRLPITHKSVFIRSVRSGWMIHAAQAPGHRMTTLLQKIPVFLKDSDDGLYLSYRDLITTHYISPLEP